MRIVVSYENQTLQGKEVTCTQQEFEEFLESFKNALSNASYFSFELENGCLAVLPKEALQRSVIKFYP